jgi:hypothetical protein
VLVNTGWSDYVFDAGYHLRDLSEVSEYIRQNHHLPEIPSAKEVEEKGVSLGDTWAMHSGEPSIAGGSAVNHLGTP